MNYKRKRSINSYQKLFLKPEKLLNIGNRKKKAKRNNWLQKSNISNKKLLKVWCRCIDEILLPTALERGALGDGGFSRELRIVFI